MSNQSTIDQFFTSTTTAVVSSALRQHCVPTATVSKVVASIECAAPQTKRKAYGKHRKDIREVALEYIIGKKSLNALAVQHRIPKTTLESAVKKLRKAGVKTKAELDALVVIGPGRHSLLPSDVEQMVLDVIKGLRTAGTPVSTATVVATAGAIMAEKHKEQLKGNGGHVELTRPWAKKWLQRHGWTKRKATSGKRHPPADLDAQRAVFTASVAQIMQTEHIPNELVYNVDETGVKIVPVTDWTMEERGANRVEVVGKDDKRQVTATIGVTATGEKLPIMMTYEGKTTRCVPDASVQPAGWMFTHSENHWSNATIFSDYVKQIIVPHRNETIKRLGLLENQKALLVLDIWEAHRAAMNGSKESAKQKVESLKPLGFEVAWIPAGCTDDMQPLDLVVNGTLKAQLKNSFTEWAQGEVTRQRNLGVAPANIKLTLDLGILKPLHVGWVETSYAKVTAEMICGAFVAAGILKPAETNQAAAALTIEVDDDDDDNEEHNLC